MRRLFIHRTSSFSALGAPELKNPEREIFYFRRRLTIGAALIVFGFAGLLGRFIHLQVFQHGHYQTLAESNRIAIVPIVPNRGVITDRNGIVLAQSYSAYTLEVTPSRVRNLDETIDALGELVDIQPRDRKRFKRVLEETRNFESLPLRTRLSDEEVARFAVNRYRFPGVEIKARLFRQYPFAELASHVIGYIGRINDRDVERIDPANWEALNTSPDKPLLNRPLRGAYPPGSTIKPFLALSALTSGKRTPTQQIFDPGFYQLAGSAHRFRDDKPGGHGYVDMAKSIIVSCDTYYYMLAGDSDIDVTHDFMVQFGFGGLTGIDIEGELPGILPSRAWKRGRFSGKNYREEHRKWYLGDSI